MDSLVLTSVVLPAAIAVIMLSLGMTLTPADFRRVLVAPRGVAIGMLNMALISPLLALTMAQLFGLSPELAVGLVLLGASPGGMMANMLTHLSHGDTALSITMTAISSVGAIVTVPLFIAVSAGHFGAGEVGDAGMLGVVARVFAITIVPVAIGMGLRQRHPERVDAAYPGVRNVSLTLLGLVILGAIAVGASLATEVTVPAAVYASFMLFTGGGFAWAMSRRNAVTVTAAPQTPSRAVPFP